MAAPPRDLVDAYAQTVTGEMTRDCPCAQCGMPLRARTRAYIFLSAISGVYCTRRCARNAATSEAIDAAIRRRIEACKERIVDEQAQVDAYEHDLARLYVPELFPSTP